MTNPRTPWIRLFVALAAVGMISAKPEAAATLAGEHDPSFAPGSAINGNAWAAAEQNDGKIVIGGEFTTVEGAVRKHLARLSPDGSTDHTFMDGEEGPDGIVLAIVTQPDGKIIIGGDFRHVNGVFRRHVARLHPDGSLDLDFHPQMTGERPVGVGRGFALHLQEDGKILVGGAFNGVGGEPRNNIARLLPDGSLDPSFGDGMAGTNGIVRAIATEPDGSVLIGGDFTEVHGVTKNYFARLHADGSLASTGGTHGPNGRVYAITVQDDGRILVGGRFWQWNGVDQEKVARLHPGGARDSSFKGQVYSSGGAVRALVAQPDGKVIFGGDLNHRTGFGRLQEDGTPDPDFFGAFPVTIRSVVTIVQRTNGKLVVGGSFEHVRGVPRFRVAQIDPDGSLDDNFQNNIERSGPDDAVDAVLVNDDGTVLIGGAFSTIQGQPRPSLARLNEDGSLDETFDVEIVRSGFLSQPVRVLARQSDGRIVVAGHFSTIAGESRGSIARIFPDGTLDLSFGEGVSGADGEVRAVAFEADGSVLIGGSFTEVNGLPRQHLARLSPDGELDPDFAVEFTGSFSAVEAIVVQADGKIVVGGSFSSVRNEPRSHLARLRPDGSLDATFAEGFSGTDLQVYAIALQGDGKILIGGRFQEVHGMGRNRLARLFTDGTVDPTFSNTQLGLGQVRSLYLLNNGKILAGGLGTTGRLHRLFPDGSLDPSFRSATFTDYAPLLTRGVNSVAVDEAGRVIAGGSFTLVNGEVAIQGVARFHANPPNQPPVDLLLSGAFIDENEPAGFLVGAFTAVDPNPYDWHEFALVSGEGDEGNTFFSIEGNDLRTATEFDAQIRDSYTIRVRGTDQDGLFIEKNFELTVGEDRFRSWARVLPEGEQEEADDPGGFGVENLLRYAFGMDPLAPERELLPRISTELVTLPRVEPAQYLTITYIRRTDDDRLRYFVEGSGDLVTWAELVRANHQITDNGDGITQTVTVRDSFSIEGRPGRFLRIRVER